VNQFTTASVDVARQLNKWREIMGDVYYSVDVLRDHRQLRGSIDEAKAGQVSVTRFDSDEQRVQRTRSCISRSPDDSYVMVFPRRKALFYSQAGRSGFIQPGDYVLIHTNDFYELSCPDGFLNWTVKLGGSDLRRRMPNVDDHLSAHFPANKPVANLVLRFAQQVARCSDSLTPSQAEQLGEKLIDLAVIAVSSDARPHGLQEKNTRFVLRQRVIQFIQADLEDSDLCPKNLAQQMGISVGYLHRVFAEQGSTLSEYIVEQRLARAYARLASHSPQRESITQIAYQVGFKNCSHFSKAFHQRYGQSPTQLRGKLLY